MIPECLIVGAAFAAGALVTRDWRRLELKLLRSERDEARGELARWRDRARDRLGALCEVEREAVDLRERLWLAPARAAAAAQALRDEPPAPALPIPIVELGANVVPIFRSAYEGFR